MRKTECRCRVRGKSVRWRHLAAGSCRVLIFAICLCETSAMLCRLNLRNAAAGPPHENDSC
jgi:hypothetical protein